jgi:UDP-glucose 4-epimerase
MNGWSVSGIDIDNVPSVDIDETFSLKDRDIDVVFHMAARSSVSEGETKSSAYFKTNLGGTGNVISALPDNVPIIFSSTAAVYCPLPRRLRETDNILPTSVYGRTKAEAERLIVDSGRPYTILRYFNVAGSSNGLTDNPRRPITHLIPGIVSGKPIQVFGTDYRTPDGSAIRDYIHVEDVCRAHLRAAERLLDGGRSLTANIGSGGGHSVLEVLDTAREVLGRSFSIQYAGRRNGDPDQLVADTSLARSELDFVPKFDLADMIRSHRI